MAELCNVASNNNLSKSVIGHSYKFCITVNGSSGWIFSSRYYLHFHFPTATTNQDIKCCYYSKIVIDRLVCMLDKRWNFVNFVDICLSNESDYWFLSYTSGIQAAINIINKKYKYYPILLQEIDGMRLYWIITAKSIILSC